MKWLQGLLKESMEPAPVPSNPPVSVGTDAASQTPGAPSANPDSPAALPVAPPQIPVLDEGTPPVTGGADAQPAFDWSPLLSRLDELGVRQNELGQLFESRLRSDEVQGKTLERLHDELQQYKSNFVRQSLTPLLKEVIFCHDFVIQQAEKLRQGNAGEAASASLDAVRQMLVDLLFKFDVEPFRRDEESSEGASGGGLTFDPRTQQCLRTIATDQPELDKRIAALGACGFRNGETILRREMVSVYKYTGVPRAAAGTAGETAEGAGEPAVKDPQAAAP